MVVPLVLSSAPTNNPYFDGLTVHHFEVPAEAVYFFALFSRFEFALKRGGFCTGAPGEKAGPNWDTFANQLGEQFFNAVRMRPETEVLFREPPRALKVGQDGEPFFQDQAAPQNAADLFVASRRIRNNLFHGDKAVFMDRDRQLIGAATFVLENALEQCNDAPLRRVGSAFAYAIWRLRP
jgi:hypothetical protein